MPDVETYSESFRVRSYEATPEAEVSVQSICNYLQEAAGNHARQLGLSIEQLEDLTWVLGKLHLHLDHVPSWRQTIDIETWPSGENGLIATRDFLLSVGGFEFGRATSAWFMLNIQRRRPVRMPRAVRDLRLPSRPPTLPHEFPPIHLPDEFSHETEFRVRYSDLDMNRHVNNVRYVEWALEGVPRHLIAGYRLSNLEVHFKAETVAGEIVRVQTAERPSEEEGISFVHRLATSGAGREVAILTSLWKERASR